MYYTHDIGTSGWVVLESDALAEIAAAEERADRLDRALSTMAEKCRTSEERGAKAERERIIETVKELGYMESSVVVRAIREMTPSPAPAKKLEMPKQVEPMSGMEYELYDAVCSIIAYLNERGEK